jgi:hypothetical protein
MASRSTVKATPVQSSVLRVTTPSSTELWQWHYNYFTFFKPSRAFFFYSYFIIKMLIRPTLPGSWLLVTNFAIQLLFIEYCAGAKNAAAKTII